MGTVKELRAVQRRYQKRAEELEKDINTLLKTCQHVWVYREDLSFIYHVYECAKCDSTDFV